MLVPWLAVATVVVLLALFAILVDLDRAAVPKPPFHRLQLEGWPDATPLGEAALVLEAAMWWLCLSFLLWVAALCAAGLCWHEVREATRRNPALARRAGWTMFAAVAAAVLALACFALVLRTPLMPFRLVVDNLAIVSTGFVRLSTVNTALAFVVGALLLLGVSLLLMPGAHAGQPMLQMRAITRLMYAAAAFLLAWIYAATGMYRLAALLLGPVAREPILKLAPTIALMGGLFLSLLLAAAYLSACVWLQRRHDDEASAGAAVGEAASPHAFLVAHWPKVIAILMPLLPGAAESVLQAMPQLR